MLHLILIYPGGFGIRQVSGIWHNCHLSYSAVHNNGQGHAVLLRLKLQPGSSCSIRHATSNLKRVVVEVAGCELTSAAVATPGKPTLRKALWQAAT